MKKNLWRLCRRHRFLTAGLGLLLLTAFSQQRDFTTEDVLAAIRSTIPLSVTFKETINKLIAWAGSGRARMASSQQETQEAADQNQLYYNYNSAGESAQ